MVPRQLWEYGVNWVSEVMTMTRFFLANSVNGEIPLKTGPTRICIYPNTLSSVYITKYSSMIIILYFLVNLVVG